MTALKYQYFRERRSINEQYSKNNIVDTTISKDYQNKNYVTKEQEKKLVKIKKENYNFSFLFNLIDLILDIGLGFVFGISKKKVVPLLILDVTP